MTTAPTQPIILTKAGGLFCLYSKAALYILAVKKELSSVCNTSSPFGTTRNKVLEGRHIGLQASD